MDRSKRAINRPKRFEDEAFDTPEAASSQGIIKVKLTATKQPKTPQQQTKISLPSLAKARETPKETPKPKDAARPKETPRPKEVAKPKEITPKETPKAKEVAKPKDTTPKETPRPKEVAKAKDTTPKPIVAKPAERDGPLVYRPKMKRPRTPPVFEDVIPNLKLPFWDARTAAEQHENDEICELVHCHCGVNEEIGWIIQCETCLTWQHSHCLGIEQPQTPLDGYTCRACSEPKFARESMRWAYDQEWLSKGVMKQFSCDKNPLPEDKVKLLQQINQLIAEALRLQRIIHSLRVKSALHERASDDDPELKSYRVQQADGTNSAPKTNLKLDIEQTEEFVKAELAKIEQQLVQIDDGRDSQFSIDLVKNDLYSIRQYIESKSNTDKPETSNQMRSPLNVHYARMHE